MKDTTTKITANSGLPASIKGNIPIICISIFAICYFLVYNIYVFWDVPVQDTIFDFLYLPDHYYGRNLSFQDFRNTYGENGMIGYDFLFLINSIVFSLSMNFDVVITCLLTILCLFLVLRIYIFSFEERTKGFYIGLFLIAVVMCMPSQLASFGMQVQVRLGVSLGFAAIVYAEKYRANRVKYYISLFILLFLSYFVFGTMYTFAWTAAALVVYIIKICFKRFKRERLDIAPFAFEIAVMLAILVAHFVFYPRISQSVGDSTESMDVMDGIYLIKFIFHSLGSATLPYSTIIDGQISKNLMYANDVLVIVATLVALYLYTYTKMFKKTLIPPIMILFTVAVFGMVAIGRGMEDFDFGYNSWYNQHTKFLLAAIIWIFVYAFYTIHKKTIDGTNCKGKTALKIGIIVLSVLMILVILFGQILQFNRMKLERLFWHDNVQYYTDLKAIPVDEDGYTPFFSTVDKVFKGIEIMRDYNLGYYAYPGKYTSELQTMDKNGYREDGWVGTKSNFKVKTGGEGKIEISGYYPGEITDDLHTDIFIDDIFIQEYTIPSQSFTIEVDAPPDSKVDLRIENQFLFEDGMNSDERELCFILLDVQGGEPSKYTSELQTMSKTGYLQDGWVEIKSNFKVKTGSEGKIEISGHYPGEITNDLRTDIFINDVLIQEYTITSEAFAIEVDAPPDSKVDLRIENRFVFEHDMNVDDRELCFIVSDIQGK
jgi:hypothetical protein